MQRDVQILMGSNSDAPVMRKAVEVLDALGVTSHMTVASAHRSPARVQRIIEEAPTAGVKVFIVGAGAAAHLAGVVAAHSALPVIGVPIDSSPLKGWDALLATVQMPPGVPVATVSVGFRRRGQRGRSRRTDSGPVGCRRGREVGRLQGRAGREGRAGGGRARRRVGVLTSAGLILVQHHEQRLLGMKAVLGLVEDRRRRAVQH